MTTPSERRVFSRIHFDAWAELRQGERHWHAPLIDLSLKGLLVSEPEDWDHADSNQPLQAAIHLDNQLAIEMTVLQRHRHDGHLGFECQSIDLDSITNLRRLVELNLGDPDLLERQLGALGTPQQLSIT